MKQEFTAVIQQHENINGAFVEPPFDVEKIFGAKRVKVLATFNGEEYRGSIVRMGNCFMLGLTQEIRKKIGKDFGDLIEITVEKDEAERTIEIPTDFLEAMNNNPEAVKTYESLSFTNKKIYVAWITEAKRTETRADRVEKAVAMLSEGKKLR
jgi:flagellar biosynthesis regulator FlaF